MVAHFTPPSQIPPFFLRPAGSNLLLLLLALLFLFPGTDTMPLMDRDEPKFAQATVEMMARETLTVPYFNDEYRFDKPPLVYWWMRLHYHAFGVNEWSARLHSVLAAALTAMVIASLGRFLLSPVAGLLAGVAWLSCLQVMVHVGRLCVADMPMILFVTLTGYALARLLLPENTPAKFNRWWWLLMLSQVGGFLAKGPIALIVPLLGLVLTRWVFGRGQTLPWSRLQPLAFVPLYLLGIGLWGIPALQETHGLFWKVGMGEHVVERGTRSFNGRIPIPGFYFVSVFLSLLPWTGLLPEALRRDAQPRSRMQAFLLGWFAAPFLIFSFYTTQLPHYVVPGFPAFFLLLFRAGALPTPSTLFARRFAWSVAGFFLILGVLALCFAFAIPLRAELSGLREIFICAALMVITSGVAATLAMRGRILPVALTMLAGSVLIWFGGRLIKDINPAAEIAEIMNTLPAETAFRAAVFNEPSMVFYTRAGWKFQGNQERIPESLAWLEKSRQNKPRAAVFLLREWTAQDALKHLVNRHPVMEVPATRDLRDRILPNIAQDRFESRVIRGYNNGRSSWVEILVVFPKNLAPTI